MAGRWPKDPALRQRRNKTTGGATLSAESESKRRTRALPKILEGDPPQPHEWHPLTRAWWRDVWRSPMASEYVQADVHGLYRLAALVDQFWHEPDKELAGEIRLQQQCFGLTPLDRRRLQWEVERVEEVTRRRAQRQPQQQSAGEDPRAALRIVK